MFQEIHRSTNISDRKLVDCHSKIENSVARIKSSEEYSKFIELNKTSPPPSISFKFEVINFSWVIYIRSLL